MEKVKAHFDSVVSDPSIDLDQDEQASIRELNEILQDSDDEAVSAVGSRRAAIDLLLVRHCRRSKARARAGVASTAAGFAS
jgi:hypothetical protein